MSEVAKIMQSINATEQKGNITTKKQ